MAKRHAGLILMQVKIKKLHDNAVIPKYAKNDDAGMDITATSIKKTQDYIEYGTGLSFEIPKGHVCLIFPRSSLSNKDLIQANHVGVLDSGYRGELILRYKVVGEKIYKVGERIAQIIIIPYPKIEFEETNELSGSERKDGGFGSSGE